MDPAARDRRRAALEALLATEQRKAVGYQNTLAATTNPAVRKQAHAGLASVHKSIEACDIAIAELAAPPATKKLTALDLVKYDTPLSTTKVSRVLELLQYRLQTETQISDAADRMLHIWKVAPSADRRLVADAEAGRVEAQHKIRLIEHALGKYKKLLVAEEPAQPCEPNETSLIAQRRENRKLSGTLLLTILGARDLDHLPVRVGTKKRETYITVRNDKEIIAHTSLSRSDEWREHFAIPIASVHEIEFVIHDNLTGMLRSSEKAPIGLVWVRLADVVDEQRRIKNARLQTLMNQGGANSGLNNMGSMRNTLEPDPITARFTVEPEGALELTLNFVKSSVTQRPYEGALGRKGAVRKKQAPPAESITVLSHKFVCTQFYTLIRCAVCGDTLIKDGFKCEYCSLACHRRCLEDVFTRCMSRMIDKGDQSDPNGILDKYKIPHRFEPFTNLGTNWCFHCGHMLPIGRRSGRKCSECSVTAHGDCTALMPHICGLSPEMKVAILAAVRGILKPISPVTRSHASKPLAPIQPANYSSPPSDAAPPSAPVRKVKKPASSPPKAKVRSSNSPSHSSPSFSHIGVPSPPRQASSPVKPAPLSSSSSPCATPRAPETIIPGKPTEVSSPPETARSSPKLDRSTAPRPTVVEQAPPPVQSTVEVSSPIVKKVSLEDYNFLSVLGKGNFGKVMLAEERATGDLVAIKVLKKAFCIENDEIESLKSEKRVFLAASQEKHPFLLSLHACFQTTTRIYFVMEYISGGDLMMHIQTERFSRQRTKFYAAEVLLALEYFHSQGIVYRDLKLDNLLLTLDGHVKVADYGLCKENMYAGATTTTFCGTPEFMAPEILLERPYTRAVDWWAFGILLYEMILGQAPFQGGDEEEIFDAILEDEPLFPLQMPPHSVPLLMALLQRDPAKRLGAGEEDAAEIKRHPYFADVDWDALYAKKIEPPFKPTLKSKTDTSWFDTEFTSERPTLTPVNSVLSPADQNEFADFSWP